MALRCKPGDLVIIIGDNCFDGVIAIVDRLTKGLRYDAITEDRVSGVTWRFKKPVVCRCGEHEGWGEEDDKLIPIRDPGPDAVDEMVLRIPVPSTEKEPA